MQEVRHILKSEFVKIYNQEPQQFFFAPGRVNFIGEHIDYNGGNVMPFAIDKGIYAAVSLNSSNKIQLYSSLDKSLYQIDISEDLNNYKNSNLWIKYPIGIIQAVKNQGYILNGLSIYYWSNLPTGSGLSSSASIEVLTAYILFSQKKSDFQIDRIQLALLSQQVENQFIGVKCGIMDQFSVTMGKKDHFIFLDTHSLEYEYLRFNFPDTSIVVINSNKPRALSDSKYNERRTECNLALEILQKNYKIKNLVNAQESMFHDLNSETLKKRALHVITEQKRVLKIKELLNLSLKEESQKEYILTSIGEMLTQSHYSLKNLYEVSCYELDIIVEESNKIDGVYGARMTGAGFGGCAIALVQKNSLESYKQIIYKKYKEKTSLEPQIFEVHIEDGVKII